MEVVYKVLTLAEWEETESKGAFAGSAADVRDGFIHFSTASQTEDTVARLFSGTSELVLAAVKTDALGSALRWEPSRGGALFPHLYALLRASDILWAKTFDARGRGELRNLLAG